MALADYLRNIGSGSVSPTKLNASNRKYTFCSFQNQGAFVPAAGTGTATGTTGDTNYGVIPADIGGVLPVAYHIKGTQTIVAPTFSSAGMNVAHDQTSTDGVEYIFGGNTARGKHAYTVGNYPRGSAAFFASLTFSLTTANGTADCMFGFRLDQAAQAAHTSYTDYAVMGIFTAASPSLIQTKTRLNSGTASLVSTTQTKASATSMTFTVVVDRLGRTFFSLDNQFPTVSQAFTFDAGDVVYPFFWQIQNATTTGAIPVTAFSSGYIDEKGL